MPRNPITPAITKYKGCLIRLQPNGKLITLSREYDSIEQAKEGIDSALLSFGSILRRDNPHIVSK